MRAVFFAALMIALVAKPAVAAKTDGVLAKQLSAITAHADNRVSFGIAVYDLDKKQPIYGMNADKLFLAASTTKLLTEATTLATLGPDFRFTTNVYRSGPIQNGTVNGDIILRASGDPNLSNRIQSDDTLAFQNEDHSYDGSPDTKAVAGDPLLVLRDFAKQIAAKGITRITGRVIVDDSLFAAGQPEGGTGAVVSPIVVNDNLVDVTVTPGAKSGDPVAIAVSPQTPYTKFVVKATTAAAGTRRTIDMNDTADAKGNQTVTITGTSPQRGKPILYTYRVASPRRFAEIALTQALNDAGVQVAMPGADQPVTAGEFVNAYTDANMVATHVSPPLREDVKVTLKVSDNLHAAMMEYLLGVYKAHAPDPLTAGFRIENDMLRSASLDPSVIVQNDGLGTDAYLQPAFMTKFLAYVRTQPYFDTFYSALPVLGVDGTLFNIQNGKPAAGKVHAKTGTWGTDDRLNSRGIVTAKGLGGYMTTRSGKHVAFSLYLNNMPAAGGADGAHIAGEILGALANAIYLYTP